MSKVYIVSEYLGEYKSERIIAVCSSPEIADKLKNKFEEKYSSETSLSEEEWLEMLCKVMEVENESNTYFNSVSEGMKELFPEYSDEDINGAIRKYDDIEDATIYIKEVDFYNDLSDISKCI